MDYLEDHLAKNVAEEWAHVVRHGRGDRGAGAPENDDNGKRSPSKRRRTDPPKPKPTSSAAPGGAKDGGDRDPVLTAFDRAFLLTDIQSRLAGVTTSGANEYMKAVATSCY